MKRLLAVVAAVIVLTWAAPTMCDRCYFQETTMQPPRPDQITPTIVSMLTAAVGSGVTRIEAAEIIGAALQAAAIVALDIEFPGDVLEDVWIQSTASARVAAWGSECDDDGEDGVGEELFNADAESVPN